MKRLAVEIPEELYKKLKIRSFQEGKSLKDYITRLIENELQKK